MLTRRGDRGELFELVQFLEGCLHGRRFGSSGPVWKRMVPQSGDSACQIGRISPPLARSAGRCFLALDMARFYTGDELGNIKSIKCARDGEGSPWTFKDETVYRPEDLEQALSGAVESQQLKQHGIQKLSFYESDRTVSALSKSQLGAC